MKSLVKIDLNFKYHKKFFNKNFKTKNKVLVKISLIQAWQILLQKFQNYLISQI